MFRPLIKCHGGKFHLRDFVISNFPTNYTELEYTESCIGGGSIIINKLPSIKETISDCSYRLICLWIAVQDWPNQLKELLTDLYYSEDTFERYKISEPKSTLSIAIKEYVVKRQSRGGLGLNFSYGDRLRGGINGDENAWNNSIKNITIISERIKNIDIRCESIVESLSRTLNNEKSFLYLDPPYICSSRISPKAYEYEMTDKQHEEYLDLANAHKGKLLISGYWSKLYEDKLSNWNIVKKSIVNHSSQQKHKQLKEEVLWKNY